MAYNIYSFKMRLYVKLLAGKKITIEVEENNTIESIKNKIYEYINVHMSEQKLIFFGKQLEDSKTVREYNIQNESTLHLILRLR